MSQRDKTPEMTPHQAVDYYTNGAGRYLTPRESLVAWAIMVAIAACVGIIGWLIVSRLVHRTAGRWTKGATQTWVTQAVSQHD